jgi:tetratricopeptide (TPR) repeat protein
VSAQVLRALACTYKYTAEANAEGLKYAETAIGLDPGLALSYALAANFHAQRKAFPWGLAPGIAETRRFATQALELDAHDPTVLTLAGWALVDVVGDLDDGAAFLLRAIDLNPNMVAARIWSGYAQIYLGNPHIAIEQCSLAVRLSPLDPRMFLAHVAMATAHFLASQYEDSLACAATANRLKRRRQTQSSESGILGTDSGLAEASRTRKFCSDKRDHLYFLRRHWRQAEGGAGQAAELILRW